MNELTVSQALKQGYKLCIAPDYAELIDGCDNDYQAVEIESTTMFWIKKSQPVYLLEKEPSGRFTSEGEPLYNRTDILLVAGWSKPFPH